LSDNPVVVHADPYLRGAALNAQKMIRTPQLAE
jgi:hypothetical protein